MKTVSLIVTSDGFITPASDCKCILVSAPEYERIATEGGDYNDISPIVVSDVPTLPLLRLHDDPETFNPDAPASIGLIRSHIAQSSDRQDDAECETVDIIANLMLIHGDDFPALLAAAGSLLKTREGGAA
jgi:hypothetical protein